MPIAETAPAKINLTLRVLGRRADGYHELESLVTFADVADRLDFEPGAAPRVSVTGPFAGDIDGPNLLERALALLAAADPFLGLGAVALEKRLPVAAGLGGGSADAAALLRAVQRANPERAGGIDWHGLAARLGADVSVCLSGKPALMRGIGDIIEPLPIAVDASPLPCVLANPRRPLSTAQVFAALAAAPSTGPLPRAGGAATHSNLAGLLAHMREAGNDLEAPAVGLLPVIAEVKAALTAQPGCQFAAMSGSGPTCFALFETPDTASRAAAALARAEPAWWVAATGLTSPLS